MHRGSLLLVLGFGSVVAAVAAQGCSSSSGGTQATTDGGGGHDGTASSSGSGSGSGSGGAEAGSSSGSEAGSSSGSGSSSGAADSGGDAPSCPAASGIPDPPTRACASQNCCSQFTTCAGDSACIAIAGCFYSCLAQHADAGGDSGAVLCRSQCEADASASSSSEFDAAFQCVTTNCSGAKPGDAGGQ